MRLKHTLILLLLSLFACNKIKFEQTETSDDAISTDTIVVEKPIESSTALKKYKNERFRNVTLKKLGDNKFRVQGQAQVFEANINWSVEDGHKEIKKGFTTATIGAPEWGTFDFTIEVEKERESSTLQLVLFEMSMKDGSRQHELAIVLE